MPILVLLGLGVSLSWLQQPLWVLPSASRWDGLSAAVAYVAITAALSGLCGRLSLLWARRAGGEISPALLRRHNVLGLAIQGWMILGLVGVMGCGYRELIVASPLVRVPLMGELAAAGPFVAALILHWLLEYPFYRLSRRQVAQSLADSGQGRIGLWKRRQWLTYNIRHNLLFIAAPVALIVLGTDTFTLAFSRWLAPHLPAGQHPAWITGGVLTIAAAVFIISPLLIVRIWQTCPLPPGPLREELEDVCRRLRLTHRGLRVWQSGNAIANAGVIGLSGRVRYVLLSDSLLANMDRRCVLAIFAHEAGHILHHHIFYSALFAGSTMVLCGWAGGTAADWLHLGDSAAEGLTVAILLAAWFVGFGRISRLFERQSDVTGAYLAGLEVEGSDRDDGCVSQEGAAVFAWALQRVALLNGMSSHQWNWRHGSIAQRINYVLWLAGTGGQRRRVDRQVFRVKALLWLAALTSAAILINEI